MADKTLMERIAQGRQYRSMSFEVREAEPQTKDDTQTKEKKSYIVEGYATTFNEPYELLSDETFIVREQVSAQAFDKCEMKDVIFQYDHCGRVFARCSNNTLAMLPDEHGLKIRADLGGTEEGRKLFEEIKGGYTTKMSFGFMVRGNEVTEEKEEEGRRVFLRTITDISRLYDVSAVSLPANDGTEISARNFCDGLIKEVEKRIADEKAKVEEKEKMEREADERTRRIALLEMSL